MTNFKQEEYKNIWQIKKNYIKKLKKTHIKSLT